MATAETAESATEFDDSTKDLGEKIVGLTLLQAKQLADYLKEVHGIEPAGGGVMMAPMQDGDGDGGAVEEQTEFDLILTGFGDSKIPVIKATPPDMKNISEYCKRQVCWSAVSKLDIHLGVELKSSIG